MNSMDLSLQTSIIDPEKLRLYEGDPWITDRTEPGVRVLYVYMALKAYGPAALALEAVRDRARERFGTELTKARLLFWTTLGRYSVQVLGRRFTPHEAKSITRQFEGEMPRLEQELEGTMWGFLNTSDAIFREWSIAGWAVNPDAVTKPLRDMIAAEMLIDSIGIDHRAIRRNNDLFKLLPRDLGEAFRILLSPTRKRAEQTLRRLAREHVRARGFHNRREETLIKGAIYWFRYRVMHEDYARVAPMSKYSKTEIMSHESFEENIIRLFDISLNFRPGLGRRPDLTRYRKIPSEIRL